MSEVIDWVKSSRRNIRMKKGETSKMVERRQRVQVALPLSKEIPFQVIKTPDTVMAIEYCQ